MSSDTATCKTCQKEYEKTKENFYTYKDILRTNICKSCKILKNEKYRKNVDHKKEYQKRKEQMKEYYLKKKNEKITCECGTIVSALFMYKHKKTLKHHTRLEKVVQE